MLPFCELSATRHGYAMKFVLLHHSACEGGRFHYRIDPAGGVESLLPESERGAHARSIGVVLSGDFNVTKPSEAQLETLRGLLLQIKLRHPDITVGGHRQVRGERTDCPGRRFPLTALRKWSADGLIEARDAAFTHAVERQYANS